MDRSGTYWIRKSPDRSGAKTTFVVQSAATGKSKEVTSTPTSKRVIARAADENSALLQRLAKR